MQELEDSVPSLLGLLEATPEPPLFCFHEAVMGSVHKCSLLPQEDAHEDATQVGERSSLKDKNPTEGFVLDCSREGDVPITNKQLKSFILSSTPLRKISSPGNLVLDSDAEGGWSFSMATPACIRQGVKETPLRSTTNEDNSTLLESTREESMLDGSKELSNCCEKLCNRVVLRPGEKPLARALFPRDATPVKVDDNCPDQHLPGTPILQGHTPHIQRIHNRFEHCTFSPILASPLISSQQHKNVNATHTKLGTDCSVVSVSLFGGLDSPCGAKQDAGANSSNEGMPFAEEEEDALMSCSQELFGSPEECSTTVRGGDDRGVASDDRRSQVKLEDNQQCLETEAYLQHHLSDFQKMSRGFSDSQLQGVITDSVQETPKAQRYLPQRSQRVQPLLSEKGTCSSSSQYADKDDQDDVGISSPHILPSATSMQDTQKHHSYEVLCNPTQPHRSKDSVLHVDCKPDYNLDRSDVLDLLFMSCSQLDAHMCNQENKASNLPPSSLPKSPVLPSLPKSPVLPSLPKSPVLPSLPKSPVLPSLPKSPVLPSLPAPTSAKLPTSPPPTKTRNPHTPSENIYIAATSAIDHTEVFSSSHAVTGTVRSICHLHEEERPLTMAPQAKRRRLSTKVFQYPSSKQLGGKGKGRKHGSSTDREDSRTCTTGKNSQVSSLNRHVSENTPNMSRHRKSGMVLNTKPPAKRVCHEDPERRKVEGLDGGDQIVAADIVADDTMGSWGKRLSTSNQVDSKVSTRCEVSSDRTELLPANSLKNSACHSKCSGQVSQLPDSTADGPKMSKVDPACETLKTSGSPVLSQQQKQKQQQQQQQQQNNVIFPGSVDMDSTNSCVAIPHRNNAINTVIRLASTRGARAPGLRRVGKKWQQKSQATAHPKSTLGLPGMTATVLHQPESVDSRFVPMGVENHGPAEGILDRRNVSPFQQTISPKPATLEDPGTDVSKLHQADLVTAETLLAEDFPELDIKTFTKAAADPEILTEPTPSMPRSPSVDKPFAEITPVSHSPATLSDTRFGGAFAGFKTASGHVVHVSDEAICRAQKLISEELGGGNSHAQDGLEGVTTPLSRKHIAADTPPASCFKTPRLVRPGGKLTSQSAFKPLQSGAETPTGSTAVPPRNALSTSRKLTKRSFKAPRKVGSVSKEEEAASLARIMRKFGSISTSSVQSHPTKLVKGRSGGRGGGRPEGESGAAHNMVESGFATARGQKLSVSVSSIQRAQQIISNEKENASISPRTSHLNKLTAAGGSEPCTAELTHQQVPISGFATASGRKLTVSATALEHAHSILGDMGQDVGTADIGVATEVVCDSRAIRKEIGTGFQTASGKNLSISTESLARAKSLVACVSDDDSSTKDIHSRMMLTGFQTAGGKGITVSAVTFEEAQSVLQEGEMDVSDQTVMERHPDAIPDAGFQKVKGRTISREAQPLQSAQPLAERDHSSYSHKEMANTLVTGFRTGSGRTLSVSMSSLQQAQNVIGSELPVVTEHSESQLSKIVPDFAEGLHAEGVSTGELCPALSAEDLDDFDVDNLGAFTQIDFRSPEDPKSQRQELVDCSQSGEPPNPKDGGNNAAGTQGAKYLDDRFPQERGCQAVLKESTSASDCRMSRVETECLTNNMDRTVSVDASNPWHVTPTNTFTRPSVEDEKLLQSLMLSTVDADDNQVPDPDGDHSCYFSTQMVRQFLDFSSDEEEEENRNPTEQHCRQEVDISLSEISSVLSENTNCVTSQLVPPFPTPLLAEAGERGEGQEEDSQAMRSLCLHQETMPIVETHLPPSGHGSSILNSQGEHETQCSNGDRHVRDTLDAVSKAVDELFEVAPGCGPSGISEVAGTNQNCNQLQRTHELPKLLPSQPSLDPPDLQPFGNTSLKVVLSPIHSSSSFQTSLASHDVGKLGHASPQKSIRSSSAPAECGQQSVPSIECKDTGLMDSSLARRHFATLSCRQSPTDHNTEIDLPSPTSSLPGRCNTVQNSQEQTLHDTLQPSTSIVLPTPAQRTDEPGDGSIALLSANVNSSQASGEVSLLNEVLTESMVDSLGEVMDVSALVERVSVGCDGGVALGGGMEGREDCPKLSMEPLPKQDLSPPRMDTPTDTQPLQSPLINVCQHPLQSPHIDGPLQSSPLLQRAVGEQINLADKPLDRRGCQGSGVAGMSSPVLTEGLQTVGSEEEGMSEKVLSSVKQTLNSVNSEDQLAMSHALLMDVRVQTSNGKDVSVPQETLAEPGSNLDGSVHIANSTSRDWVQPILMGSSPGLQASDRKSVSISEQVFRHARPVLGEGGKAKQTMPTSTSVVSSELLRGKRTDPAGDEEEECCSSRSFRIASGNKDEVSISQGSAGIPRENTVSGLQMASGRVVEILDSSVKQRQHPDSAVTLQVGTRFPGLQTASGNRVEISERSLQAARRTLQGVDLSSGTQSTPTEITPCCNFPGLQTASGNRVEISERSLQAARRTLQGVDLSSGTQSTPTEITPCCNFPGLQTASGNRVEISERSLQAARRTLQGVDLSSGTQSTPTEITPCCNFPGLQTASGNRVEISERSLQAARRTLQGVDLSSGTQSSPTEITPCRSFPGLQTASGKGVDISEASLRAARMVIHEEQATKSPGLMTAKGDQVNVSKDAVTSTLNLDTDLHHAPNHTFPGLQTASGAEVKISSAALLAAKSTLRSSPGFKTRPPVTPKHNAFPGLQTASGNQVSISEQSLAAVRKTFSGNQPQSSTTLPIGLATASGTCSSVHISNSALEAVKQVIGSEGAGPSNFRSDRIPHSTVGTLACESSGAGQLGYVSPDITQQRHTGATDRYRPLFRSSERVHDSVKPQQANIATPVPQTEGRYIPVFNSERRRGGHRPAPAPSQPPLSQPCSSHSHLYQSHTPHTRNVKGVTSTPEALYDRPYQSRPLLPMQTYVNQDGSYINATPTRRYPHSMRPGHSITQCNHNQSSLNITPSPHSSTPRPPLSHSSTPTPRPPLSYSSTPTTRPPLSHSHVLRTSYEKSHAQQSNQHLQHSNSFSYPQNSHTNHSSAVGQKGFASGFATPRRLVRPAHARTPVWGTSLARDTNRARTSAGSGWTHSFQPGTQCYRPVSTPCSEQCPLETHSGQTPPSCQMTVSTPSSHPPNTEISKTIINTTISNCNTTIVPPHSSDSTPIRATSTQIAGRDGTEHATPPCTLSPINITLSQLCALDNSQLDTETLGGGMENTREKGGGGGREEDSGYQSKNQTETTRPKSPGSDFARDVHCSSCSTKTDSRSTLIASVQAYEDEECALFAEIATELLDDSLEVFSEGEEDARTSGERTSHPKQQTPAETLLQPFVASMRPCPPSTARNSDHTNPRVTYNTGKLGMHIEGSGPLDTTAHVHPITSGPIRPQIGSLLAARLHLSSRRVPLPLAVENTTPGGHSRKQLHSLGIHPTVLRVSVTNALEFSFSGSHYFSTAVLNGAVVCVGDGGLLRLADGRAGVREFWEAFSQSPGVDPKLISFEWFANHYKWIVWKLASLEVAFPQQFAGRCLTPDWLMLQLKYRYDREIDRAERSALHKISEQDDLPSRTMVVCVSAIHTEKLSSCNESVVNSSIISKDDSRAGRESSPPPNPPCIEVTDGWYSVPAVLDMPLKRMVKCGKISLGTKLITYGSELTGGCDPSHPLEASPVMALRLHANSTRRARWFSKLGYQRVPHPFPVPLSSVFPDGGLVGCVDVVVARVYPLLCMEKVEGRRSVFRNERAETRVAAVHETARQREVERICARVQREFEEEVEAQESGRVASRRRSRRKLNTLQIKQLQDGEDIYTALMNAPDPAAFLELLSQNQHTFLESYRLSLQSQRQSELEKRVRQAIEEAEDTLPPSRNVVPLLRARLVPFGPHPPPDCQLSVWRPDEAVRGVVWEGKVLRMFNINATPSRYKSSWQLQLTASRSTRYEEIPASHDQLSRSYTPRKCTAIATVSNAELAWGEFDTVGIVVCITSANIPGSDESEHHLTSVYLADSGGALLVVKVWNGLKARALENLVIPGALVAVSNLSYRGIGHTHHLPTANAGDSCVFSQLPRDHHLKSALEEMSSQLPAERKEFLQSLEESITSSYF